jgi:peptidyl-prolyl cis-trans isomerase C
MSAAPQGAVPARRPIFVNGKPIAHAAIAREAQNHPASAPGEAWQAAARALALRELLKQEAARLGVVATPLTDGDGRVETPEEAAMRALIDLEVRTPDPTDDECRRYYENNVARFRSASVSEAAHILIAAAPDDAAARAAARTRAQAICGHLATRPGDFGDLAQEFSACSSAKQGGNLGQLSGGDTVAEFEAALAQLAPGEISGEPVETRFGYHVIRLARRLEAKQLPFELVAARIHDYLTERVRRRALQQYVAVLAGRAELRGVEFVRPETLM